MFKIGFILSVDSDVPRSDSSCELVDQLISVKWKLLKEKR